MSRASDIPWSPPFPNSTALRSRRVDGTLEDMLKIDQFDRLFLGNPNLTLFLQGAGFSQPANSLQIKPFVSAQTAIPATSSTTAFAHGLGATPSFCMASLINIITEFGWAPGQEVRLVGDPGNNRMIQLAADATNAYATNSSSALYILTTGGAFTSITNANWRLIVRAWP